MILNINDELKDSPLGEILMTSSLKWGVDSWEREYGSVLVESNLKHLFDFLSRLRSEGRGARQGQ